MGSFERVCDSQGWSVGVPEGLLEEEAHPFVVAVGRCDGDEAGVVCLESGVDVEAVESCTVVLGPVGVVAKGVYDGVQMVWFGFPVWGDGVDEAVVLEEAEECWVFVGFGRWLAIGVAIEMGVEYAVEVASKDVWLGGA